MGEYKRRWGDRIDGRWVRDVPALNQIMSNMLPNRTECEVNLNDSVDVTELMKYLEKKNAQHPEFKTTIFHSFVFAVGKMINERPKMNYFIQGRRTYERNEISLSFVAKRRFNDRAEESMMFFVPKMTDTIDDLSLKIVGDVNYMRKTEAAREGSIDSVVETVAKLPRPLLMGFLKLVRILDFWGKVPMALREGDSNFSTVLFSNLGSIKAPAVYHHLNNYGTNSIMITVGKLEKKEMLMPDGTRQMRDILPFCATLDERIADGFYFARSLKLVRHIFANPDILDKPFGEPSGFDYK